jgi:hypothetical protein
MNYGMFRFALSTAWRVIGIGQRIVRTAERMEERADAPYTLRSNIAWKLMSLGERVEAFGEALEARVDLWARRTGCGPEAVLAAHFHERAP